jgi:hypothetical protein
MSERHVHCGRCGVDLPLRVKDHGVRRDVVHSEGWQWRLAMNPAGILEPAQVKVSICDDCKEAIDAEDAAAKLAAAELQAEAERKAAAARLVVAPAGAVPPPPAELLARI